MQIKDEMEQSVMMASTMMSQGHPSQI